MKEYHFYMQPTNKAGVASGAAVDLETYYDGLKYVRCEGLELVGEPKNIYTEDYAEANGPRVYHPTDTGGEVVRKETDVKLTLLFLGENRRALYDTFVAYLNAGRLFYWDNARNLKAWLFLQKAIEPDTDYLGDEGCLKATFEFTNIWGRGRLCEDDGTLI